MHLKMTVLTSEKWQEMVVKWSFSFVSCDFSVFFLKFGLFEKHAKFEKIFLMVLTNQLIYLENVKTMRKIFSNYVCFSKSPNIIMEDF